MDEFYGGYNYTSNCDGSVVSAADNIDDVDEDDVIIIDGLTKRFRLPGWRVAWIVGPKEFIAAIGSCGSYLDGAYTLGWVMILRPPLLRMGTGTLILPRWHQRTIPGSCNLHARTQQGAPRNESAADPLQGKA